MELDAVRCAHVVVEQVEGDLARVRARVREG